MTRALRFILLAGGVGLALPTCPPAATYTEGHFTYVVKNAPAPAGVQASKKARCPSGSRVTGGGAYTSGPTVDDEVATSAPFDDGDHNARPEDGWLAEINSASSQSGTMTAYAICAPFDNLRYVRESALAGPGTGKTTHVACPAGTEPLGGGARTSSSSTSISLRQTFPWNERNSDMSWDGWQGTANNLTADSQTVTVYAICMAVTDQNYNTTGSFDVMTPLLQSTDSTPPCPRFHVSGGGSSLTAGTHSELASTEPEDGDDLDDAPDDLWRSYFNNESGTTEVAHATVQFCVK